MALPSAAGPEAESEQSSAGPHHERPAAATVRRMPAIVALLSVIAAILVGAALHATQWITMPLAFAFFAALVFWPLDSAIRRVLPRWLSWVGHLVVGLMIMVIVGAFLLSLWYAMERIADSAPAVGDEVQRFWESSQVQQIIGMTSMFAPDAEGSDGDETAAGVDPVQGLPAATLDAEAETTGDGGSQEQDQGQSNGMLRDRIVGGVSSAVLSFANGITQALGVFTLVLFFTLLMLAEVPVWTKKTIAATQGNQHVAWSRAMVAVSQRVRWYLITRGIVGVITGLLYVGWLWAFDVELLIVWFLLTFVLSFIPTLGSLISGLLPVAFALVTKDLGTAVAVGAGILVIEQVMGNFVDPHLLGRRLSLSPLVILFSLAFWGFIWGIVGALLAAPLTMLLTILLAQWQPTLPFALMLSDETDYDSLRQSVEPQ